MGRQHEGLGSDARVKHFPLVLFGGGVGTVLLITADTGLCHNDDQHRAGGDDIFIMGKIHRSFCRNPLLKGRVLHGDIPYGLGIFPGGSKGSRLHDLFQHFMRNLFILKFPYASSCLDSIN